MITIGDKNIWISHIFIDIFPKKLNTFSTLSVIYSWTSTNIIIIATINPMLSIFHPVAKQATTNTTIRNNLNHHCFSTNKSKEKVSELSYLSKREENNAEHNAQHHYTF